MIVIIDYGMGNLRSITKAFERLGIKVEETTETAGLDVSEHGERGYVQDGAD